MNKWEWENTVKTIDCDIIIECDNKFDSGEATVSSLEELQALIERLEELAEELGWNDDQEQG